MFLNLEKLLKALPEEEGVRTNIGGETLAMQESMSSSTFAIILGIVIIYMILASQFESLFQPIIVITVVPIALIGAIITLILSLSKA